MQNVVKCTRCSKDLISEEFDEHICNSSFTGIIQIGVSYWFEGKIDKNGDKILMAKGFDGKLYRLVECRHNPSHVTKYPVFTDLPKNNRKVTRRKSNREGNSTGAGTLMGHNSGVTHRDIFNQSFSFVLELYHMPILYDVLNLPYS